MKNHMLSAVTALLVAGMGAWCAAAPAPGSGQPRERTTLAGHGGIVYGVAFSPDGKVLASAGNEDETVRLWDVAKGECIAVLSVRDPEDKKQRRLLVEALAFSPDGRILAADNSQSTVLLWDVPERKRIGVLNHPPGNPEVLRFSPDGKTLATSCGRTIRLWDVASQRIRDTVEVGEGLHAEWAYGPKGKLLVAGKGVNDRSLVLWDPDAGKPTVSYEGHQRPIAFVAFSPDGKTLAANSADRTVRLWDVATGKNTATVQLPGLDTVLTCSPDGKTVAAGYAGEAPVWLEAPGFVALIDVPTGKVLATLKGHTGPVFSLAFSPDGRLLASGSCDKTIKLWSLPAEYSGDK